MVTVYYRFDPSGLDVQTYVNTVYADCGADNYCTLNSTATNSELAITKIQHNEPLNSNSNCTVNHVEIIHDCIPRCVDLRLSFTSYSDNKLYLQVRNIILKVCTGYAQ